MFRKSKRRIVAAIMGAVVLLFGLTLGIVDLTAFLEIRTQNRKMLQRFTDQYTTENETDSGKWDKSEHQTKEIPLPDSFFSSITDRRRDDRREKVEYEVLYQNSVFLSVVFDKKGKVLFVNNEESDAIPKDRIASLAKEMLASGKPEGRIRLLRYLVTEKENYTLVAFLDTSVTDRNLHTMHSSTLIGGAVTILLSFFGAVFFARWAVRPLEENDRRQKQFLSDAGHELKTPIAVIDTNAELLERRMGESVWLSNIRYETARMSELVTRLLDASRTEDLDLPMEPLDISRLVTGAILPFESVAFEQGFELQNEIAPDLSVVGNEPQLSQLVSILVDNAIRHAEGGKEICCTLSQDGAHAVLTVSNSGREIPPEEQPRLFDRFYRADQVRNTEERHYGLGLSIAKSITEHHGGKISVSSGEGLIRFTVTLPLVR